MVSLVNCSWPHSGKYKWALVLEDTGVVWIERGPSLLPNSKLKLGEYRDYRIIIRKWPKCKKQAGSSYTRERES